MKLIAFLFLVNAFTFGCQAEEVCFSTLEEYQSVKASLPELFQKVPAYFTKSVFGLGGGAFKFTPIQSVGKFKIDGGYFKFSEKKLFDSSYLKKFCINNQTITVVLENGKEYQITEIESKTLTLHFTNKMGASDHATLNLSSQQDYNKIIDKVDPGQKILQEGGSQ